MKTVTEAELVHLVGAGSARREVVAIDGYHRAGVLVPLVATSHGFDLLFTTRTEHVETHKGQVSFPGGMVDPVDTDITATALRETREEIGLPDSHVRVIGLLDDIPTPTGFVITPVVGIIGNLPQLSPNNQEVADVFQVPLGFFAETSSVRTEEREFRGRSHLVYFYDHNDRTIWGVTAVIIRSLLKRLLHL